MKKIRVYFYRPQFDLLKKFKNCKHKVHIMDNGISEWTKLIHRTRALFTFKFKLFKLIKILDCSHLEIRDMQTDLMYTSTMRYTDKEGESINGCVKRPASEVLKNKHRWFWVEFNISNEVYNSAVYYMNQLVENNEGYGFLEIGSFFVPLEIVRARMNDTTRFICSEFGHVILWFTGHMAKHIDILGKYFEIYKVQDVPSPLLVALRLEELGATFVDEKTGEVIL